MAPFHWQLSVGWIVRSGSEGVRGLKVSSLPKNIACKHAAKLSKLRFKKKGCKKLCVCGGGAGAGAEEVLYKQIVIIRIVSHASLRTTNGDCGLLISLDLTPPTSKKKQKTKTVFDF